MSIDCQHNCPNRSTLSVCRGPDCLCVCLERLLLGAYQPSVSLSGLRLIASGQTQGADNSHDSVQRAEWRPSEPVTKHTEGSCKNWIDKSQSWSIDRGDLITFPWVAGLAGQRSLSLSIEPNDLYKEYYPLTEHLKTNVSFNEWQSIEHSLILSDLVFQILGLKSGAWQQ